MTIEIRHNGNFVAHEETQERADALAKAMFGEGAEGVTTEPARPFELHCRGGFLDSFHSREVAEIALENHRLAHALSVERGGPAALKTRDPNVKLGAMHDDRDPELRIEQVGEPMPVDVDGGIEEDTEEAPPAEGEDASLEAPALETTTLEEPFFES